MESVFWSQDPDMERQLDTTRVVATHQSTEELMQTKMGLSTDETRSARMEHQYT